MIDRNGLAASREGTELLLQLLGLGATLFAVWGAMAQEIGVEFDLLAFEREPGLGAGPVSVAYGSGAPEVAMADFFDVLQPIAEFRPLSSRMVMIVGQAPPSLLPMLREQFDFGP